MQARPLVARQSFSVIEAQLENFVVRVVQHEHLLIGVGSLVRLHEARSHEHADGACEVGMPRWG